MVVALPGWAFYTLCALIAVYYGLWVWSLVETLRQKRAKRAYYQRLSAVREHMEARGRY